MRTPIVHFGKGGCACRARWRQAAFLWRSGWLERARQTAPTTPGRVSFVATLRIVSSVSLCDRNVARVAQRTAVRDGMYSTLVFRGQSAASASRLAVNSAWAVFRIRGDGADGPTSYELRAVQLLKASNSFSYTYEYDGRPTGRPRDGVGPLASPGTPRRRRGASQHGKKDPSARLRGGARAGNGLKARASRIQVRRRSCFATRSWTRCCWQPAEWQSTPSSSPPTAASPPRRPSSS